MHFSSEKHLAMATLIRKRGFEWSSFEPDWRFIERQIAVRRRWFRTISGSVALVAKVNAYAQMTAQKGVKLIRSALIFGTLVHNTDSRCPARTIANLLDSCRVQIFRRGDAFANLISPKCALDHSPLCPRAILRAHSYP